MAEFTNTTSAKTNVFNKGMVKDINELYMTEGTWSNAVNAINNSHLGETGTLSNEPSNKLCVTAPYTILGFAYISSNRWVLFSGNNLDSEIGIFDETNCEYETLVNDRCLNFKLSHPITAIVKSNYDCSHSVYWQDALNNDRTMNLNRVQEYYKVVGDLDGDRDCFEPDYSTDLDCDKLSLHPKITQPCIDIKKGQGSGQLLNGSYVAFIAMSENGVRLTDYSMPSVAQSLWDHNGIGGSLDIEISNLDTDFNEFELVIVQTVNQNTMAKKIGNYSIAHNNALNITRISIDVILASLETVPLALLPLKSVIYDKSEKMFTINNHLIRTGLTTKPIFNYQPFANKIKTEWVATAFPSEYYWLGGNKTSYLRDEVYSFFIRWVYANGSRTASYHIPGRASKSSDLVTITSSDVIDNKDLAWQVYDTSTTIPYSGTTTDGGTHITKGEMAYWESTERYPNDKSEIWGDLCGKPIRHHKMPSNETIHIHRPASDGKDEIIVLGVRFLNVQPPVDEMGVLIPDIVGYEILRGSREGNKSIVAKGMFNNMWEYTIRKTNLTKKGLFQNYPYNDLRPDPFLVRTEDYSQHIEQGGSSNPGANLTTFKQNMFSFHSPETTFAKPFLGANFVKIYTEERAAVTNNFVYPFKHPKHVLITDAAFIVAGLAGIGIGLVASLGKTTSQSTESLKFLGSGTDQTGGRESGPGSAIGDTISSAITNIKGLAGFITGAILFATNFTYFAGRGIDEVLETVRKISTKRQYALQLNSHGFYRDYSPVKNPASAGYYPSFLRKVKPSKMKYIGSGLHDFDATYRINNLYRTKYVALELESILPNPASIVDNSKATLANSGISQKDPLKYFQTNSVAYYGAIKLDYENQYGQLSSIFQQPVTTCVQVDPVSDVLYGGDIYINRYTEKNPYMFFNTWLMGEENMTEYDYRNYINGPLPRYWANFEKFDVADLSLSSPTSPNDEDIDTEGDPDDNKDKGKKLKGFFRNLKNLKLTSPQDFFRLDRAGKKGILVVKWGFFYLFANGVRDFYCESELNMAYRDYGELETEKFFDPYGNSFNDLDTIFRSDVITRPQYFKYDLSLSVSKLYGNFVKWGAVLQKDYDPKIYSSCFEYYPKRAIYSLQQVEGLKRDNWKNFLPLNYKDFGGKINSIKAMNATGAVILFEDAEPVNFVGVDQLQTEAGVKVTIGDGGLFSQNMQSLVNADDTLNYGSCISSRSVINTPFGLFYISQQAGKIFQFTGNLTEISRNGMKFWFMENLPSKLLKAFPDCELYDNPIAGIGCQAIFDAQYEIVYFCKKDYEPLITDEKIYFDDLNGVPYILRSSGSKRFIPFTDKTAWRDCSWTVSFDPKSQSFISFHEWVPELTMPSESHFSTIKGNGIWKHNDRWDSYANYYGQDYPWEVEFPVTTPNAINSVRNVEYYLDVLKYYNNGMEYHHVLDENFDRAVVFNSEQISGVLKLDIIGKKSPLNIVTYPIVSLTGIKILYSKEENKYRFNQFWDIVKDRGEFSGALIPLWEEDPSGFRRLVNPNAIDYLKPPTEHKKFRHYANRVILRKLVSGDKNMIFKLANTKLLASSR